MVRGAFRLNRGTARPAASAGEPGEFASLRSGHAAWLAASTLMPDGPVVELDRPTAGIYVDSRRGVYLDLYLGVAQRLFDDDRLWPAMQPLLDHRLALRREINTDDYLGFAPPGIALPQDLARLVAITVEATWPRPGGYRVFFSTSGTEAVEAAVKACALAGYRRFLARRGAEAWAAVCRELGIARDPSFEPGEVWSDYPLFFLALDGAFHGRTLGSLALTHSRPVHRVGFPRWRWVRHVSPSDASSIGPIVDPRPIDSILAEPGELARVVASGGLPGDLLAGAIFEPFQGEGGYRAPAAAVLQELRSTCDRFGALLVADEVQTFARTGTTFMCEQRNVRPDILCMAKAAVVGTTVIPADTAALLERGWHSNTLGSGRIFDVNYAHAAWQTFLQGQDPLFLGLSFRENEAVKGAYLRQQLEGLGRETRGFFSDVDGAGCIWGLTVPDQARFVREAWRQGAKMLGAGEAAKPGRVRIILPADVLTKEVDDLVTVLRRTRAALEGS